MAASTGMIKDKKPLELIWNDSIPHLGKPISPGSWLPEICAPAAEEGLVFRMNKGLKMNSGLPPAIMIAPQKN
jgi:hypothetical protein